MMRRTPRSTRTETLIPITTLFVSLRQQSRTDHQRPELDGSRWRLHHAADRRIRREAAGPAGIPANGSDFHRHVDGKLSGLLARPRYGPAEWLLQIGRASCRERVCQYV